MSGIAGMVCADGGAQDPRLLDRMAARLAFRGPDASQTWTRGEAGFCFTFLRTGPAPQANVQPLSIDDRNWLLGDVRLDGREELCQRLEERGELADVDATDEELILRAWRLWGEACLPELLGDFCFVIWDAEARRLLCVRDVIGACPFFYAQAGGKFYFSNTLEVVRLAPDISADLDPHFIGDFLLQAWCPDPKRTVFRDIRRLEPGHVLEFSNGQTRSRPFKTLPVEEPLWLNEPQEYTERYLELLEQAVCDRMPRQSTGFSVSGGLDSTSVAAMAAKIARENGSSGTLRAFTVSYRPLFEDPEEAFALLAAQHFDMPIDVLPAANFLPFEGLADGQIRTPEPIHEVYFAMQRSHFRQIAEYTHVVFSGDGGDDVLTGQSWPYLVYLIRQKRWGALCSGFGGYVLQHGRFPPLRGGFRKRLGSWLSRADEMAEYPSWLNPAFEKEMHLRERWRELLQPPKPAHPLHPSGYEGLSSGYWASVLEMEDAGWTGAAVQARAPLLDFRILSFLLRIPPVPQCIDKRLVRQAMKELLPEEIRTRPKTPLAQDPLQIHIEGGAWRWTPLQEKVAAIENFVDEDRMNATLSQMRGSSAWGDLRPVSLLYWLKG